jgi:hypothetical protein
MHNLIQTSLLTASIQHHLYQIEIVILYCYRRMNTFSTCATPTGSVVCRFSGKEVLLVGFELTTLTNWVNALTTELQSPYFSMHSYSIYIMVLLQGTQNSNPVPVLCYCVSLPIL